MLRRTIQCVDPAMNAFQAPPAPPARPHSDRPEAADAQPSAPDAKAKDQPATPEPAPEPAATAEDMSGWAMGGSD